MAVEVLPGLLGGLVGAVVALTGAGGGILAVPLLVLVLGLPMQAAAPIGLMAVGVSAALGALLGWREGILRYRAAALMGLLGMLAAPWGVRLAQHLPNQPLLLAFAALLLFIAFKHWVNAAAEAPEGDYRGQPCKIDPAVGRLLWTLPCARALAGTGLLSGVLSGLLGVGGGFIIVPALGRYTDLTPRSVVVTSLGVMTLVATGGMAGALWHGSVNPTIALPFALGALVGLLAGRQWAKRLAGPRLRQGFAILCVGVAALLVARAMGGLAG